MSGKLFQVVCIGLAPLTGGTVAYGQHDFQRTRTVDKSGRADETTIQGAIDSITPAGKRWTVLIYAGQYDVNNSITLDDLDEGIDLVGVDRDSVIINVTGADTHGIVITSGTETSRNNRIANLTIKTSDGHGIHIVKGGTPVPKDITIENVTIEVDGTGNHGISGAAAEDVTVVNCDVTSDDADGIVGGKGWTVTRTRATANVSNSANGRGFVFDVADANFIVSNCVGLGKENGLYLKKSDGVELLHSVFEGGESGLLIEGGKNVLVFDCDILADKAHDATLDNKALVVNGVTDPDCVIVKDCRTVRRNSQLRAVPSLRSATKPLD